MTDLTAEERALLGADAAPATAEEARPRRGRPARVTEEPKPERGPHTPAQFDDDGWNDLPVQMRN